MRGEWKSHAAFNASSYNWDWVECCSCQPPERPPPGNCLLRGAQRRQSWAVEGQAVGAGGKSRSASTPSWEASCVQSLLIKMLIFRQLFPLCSQKYFGLLLPLSCSLPLSTVCGSRLALSATTALLRWKGSTSYVQNQPSSQSAVVNNCVGSLHLPSLFLSLHTI